MSKNRNLDTFIILALAIVLIIITISIAYINFQSQTEDQNIRTEQIRQIEQTQATPTSSPTPTPYQIQPEILPPQKAEAMEQLLMERLQNRQPLSQNDSDAKSRLLGSLPQLQTENIFFTSRNIRIIYQEVLDVFQIEITTTNITDGKNEAVEWFLAQGISYDAICNYPVYFYLNHEVKLQLGNTGVTIYPFAPHCQ